VNVLGFFAGKLQERAHAVIVSGKLWPHMVNDVRQYKLFNQAEHREILMAANLIQRCLLSWA
jgi:hypothetical protein